MKVAKLYDYFNIRIEEMPIPKIGAHEALLKTKVSGICSGDVMPWYIERKAPLVLGHEPAGQIIEVGKNVTSFQPGARVFIHHHAPCCSCRYCQRGDYVHCNYWKQIGIVPGGISEYILVNERNLHIDTHRLSDDLSYEDGTLVEPTACVVKSLKRLSVRQGDTILVLGLGVMGQLHVILSKTCGAGKIIGADKVPFRLEKAREFGADEVIDVSKVSLNEFLDDVTDGLMADVVIVCPNSVEAMTQGISVAGSGGKVMIFTPAKPGEILYIDPNEIYFKDISLITSYSCGPEDTKEALGYIERGVVRADQLITHRFTIDETEQAYRLTAEARDSLKCVVVFD
jgi:L-iditol 2-dehydrogenase